MASNTSVRTDKKAISSFCLFRRFVLVSIVAVIGIVLVATVGLRFTIQRYVLSKAEDDAINVSIVLRNHEIRHTSSTHHEIEEVPLVSDDFVGLDRRMRAFLAPFDIVKIKIFDTDTRIVYSTDKDIIGRFEHDNAKLLASLNGAVMSKYETKDHVWDLADEERMDCEIVETYVPVKDHDGNIMGSFEIYKDVTSDLSKVNAMLACAVLILLGIVMSAFAVFGAIMHRAAKTIQSSAEALSVSNAQLCQEIGERKGAQQELLCRQKNVETVLNASPVGMLLINDQLIVKQANKVIGQMLGRDNSDIVDQRAGAALGCVNSDFSEQGCGYSPNCPSCPINEALGDVLNSKQPIHGVEIQLILEVDGCEVSPWLLMSAEPVDLDNTAHIVVALSDITDRKITEENLKKVNIQLKASAEEANLMAREAVKADHAKSEFLTNMSHEIRTPMNGIMGFSDLLISEELSEDQKQYVEMIRKCSQNMMVVINDILDVSKIESGTLKLEVADFELDHLISSVESLLKPQAVEKGLEFEIRQSANLPNHINTDSVRLRQCLINLIGNAIKFTEEGYVHINVSSVDDAGKTFLCFDIEDTGIGINSSEQDAIFELFIQADGSSTRKYGGTGLGLAITKQLAELLGGQISLESKIGAGSTFTLKIPVLIGNQPEAGTNKREDAKTDKSEQSPEFHGKVLVAEDSEANQTLIRMLLEKIGLEVTMVENGKQAFDIALSQPFDLILMDIQMLVMNGYEATKLMRENGITVPIIAVTAHAMSGDDRKCFEAGCDDYLSKPINRLELVETIRKYISPEPVLIETAGSSDHK